jgi:hypothetical protein
VIKGLVRGEEAPSEGEPMRLRASEGEGSHHPQIHSRVTGLFRSKTAKVNEAGL